MHDYLGGASFQGDYTSLRQVLPNTTIGEADRPESEAFLIGQMVDVRKGAAFIADDEFPNGRELDYDDPTAGWRLVVLDVMPSGRYGALQGTEGSVEITWTVTRDLDFESVRTAFMSYGTVAVPLWRKGVPRTFSDDPWDVVRAGELFMYVDESGRLRMPFRDSASPDMLRDVVTLGQLQSELAAPRRVLPP